MKIFIDIETIPTSIEAERDRILTDAYDRARTADPPSTYKRPETIARWREDQIAEAEADGEGRWRKTALSGDWGEIVCISWALDDDPVSSDYRGSLQDSERDVLGSFWRAMAETKPRFGGVPTWVGHNIEFDLRYLHHRSVVHNVRPTIHTHHNTAPWRTEYRYDTMQQWCGMRDRIKLTELCRILGIDITGDIDGSQVWDHFVAGDIDSIRQHCEADVERVRQVYRRLTWGQG